MNRLRLAFLVGAIAASTSPASLQESPRQTPGPPEVQYETVAPGVQAAQLLRTDALRGVIVEIKDIIVGPGKSAADLPVGGYVVTELTSGEAETTIDDRTAKRRPGEFWVVRPGQKYGVKSLGAMVVLHVTVFSLP